MIKFLGATLGVCLVLAAPSSAAAQQTTVASPADPAELAEAHAIMEIAFPPAQRDEMMDKIFGSMNGLMRQNIPANLDADPGAKALFTDLLDKIGEVQRVQSREQLPKILDAMAIAYTHEFSLAELKDVHAFARTPSGQRYLSRASALMSDPEVTKVMTDMIKNSQQRMAPVMTEFREKVAVYFKAHPEAAKKLEPLPVTK